MSAVYHVHCLTSVTALYPNFPMFLGGKSGVLISDKLCLSGSQMKKGFLKILPIYKCQRRAVLHYQLNVFSIYVV